MRVKNEMVTATKRKNDFDRTFFIVKIFTFGLNRLLESYM